MDLEKAMILLEINKDDIIDIPKIKRHYHKLCLKYHPDKNKNNTTLHFQEINEAYHFIIYEYIIEYNIENENMDNNENLSYTNILKKFILSIIANEEVVDKIINIIINGCKDLTNKLIHEIDINMKIKIYLFLRKYKDILFIKDIDYILTQLSPYIDKLPQTYILNPTIDDILGDNIYKLIIDDDTILYIPLWIKENIYDCFSYELCVLCNPVIDENININGNDIIINIKIDMYSLLDKEYIEYKISDKYIFKIFTDKLKFHKKQYYLFEKMGISKYNEDDIYDIKDKGDIIFDIIFI